MTTSQRHALQMILAPLTIAALGTACTAVKVSSWTSPDATDRAPGKVLIIGVTDSDSTRRQYEELFVAALQDVGVPAMVSHKLISDKTAISKAKMAAIVDASEADSVLVTTIIDEKDRISQTTPMVYPSYYHSPHGFYSHSYSYMHAPISTRTYTEVLLETNLYDAKTQTLIWSGRKKVTDDRSSKKNMALITKAIIKDLKKNNLLTPAPVAP
jgi:hypothetical protein